MTACVKSLLRHLRTTDFVGVAWGHISNQFTHKIDDSTMAEVARLADGLLGLNALTPSHARTTEPCRTARSRNRCFAVGQQGYG